MSFLHPSFTAHEPYGQQGSLCCPSKPTSSSQPNSHSHCFASTVTTSIRSSCRTFQVVARFPVVSSCAHEPAPQLLLLHLTFPPLQVLSLLARHRQKREQCDTACCKRGKKEPCCKRGLSAAPTKRKPEHKQHLTHCFVSCRQGGGMLRALPLQEAGTSLPRSVPLHRTDFSTITQNKTKTSSPFSPKGMLY